MTGLFKTLLNSATGIHCLTNGWPVQDTIKGIYSDHTASRMSGLFKAWEESQRSKADSASLDDAAELLELELEFELDG